MLFGVVSCGGGDCGGGDDNMDWLSLIGADLLMFGLPFTSWVGKIVELIDLNLTPVA